MDDRCAIIVFVTIPAQSLLVSCPNGIYLRFQCTQTCLRTYWQGLAPTAVYVLDVVNLVYLLDNLNMILVNNNNKFLLGGFVVRK